jgi:tetratricopeptide (TPR) repeat protein
VRAQAHYHLGSTLKRRGRHEEARLHLTLANSDDGSHLAPALRSAAHFHAGELELDAGHIAEAAAHLRRCLELNPDHARARTRLEEVSAASAA